MLIGLLAAVASAGLFGVAAVAQATAFRGIVDRGSGFGWFLSNAWRHPLMIAVLAAYLVGFVLHAVAIALVPLYLAQAAISLSLPITAWVASRRLGESLGWPGWGAISAIGVGLILLAVGAGSPGPADQSQLFVALLWLSLATLGALSWLAQARGAGVLAALSGVGYAGSAIGVRAISGLDALSVLSGIVVPAYGALAFWLYSVAMDRGTVARASGAVIVGQTLIPSMVGLLWLGDRVRSGWELSIVCGLACAIAGAVALSRRADLSD
jgi:hypothetical protein